MKSKLIVFLAALLIVINFNARAQENTQNRLFSVEINPLAFAFGGWSIGGTYHPNKLNRWVFNTAAYRFKMPKTFVEQIPGNENKGFELRINSAFSLGADYYPWKNNRSGFAFGISAVYANFEVTNKHESGEANYSSLYLVPRTSYTWFVFRGLYVMPWVGVEFHQKISGNTQVGSQVFKPMTTQFSPNISIGYAFK
jgi:hypothetical protein